ncbi:flagellar hook-associated protein FlgK [Caldimonas tepidiphila]|uniref:flagellar hook-associated protein FlgK n=1 Tax=Caldimonas tepidiphila TaxID=2315841 RepID=UPI000E5B8F8F|nr:flagellar hook-associated protein FlgK [Caldimonas tepidiphila]
MPGLINIGARAMYTAQAQLTVTSSNIANAGTPGYSRQSVQLQTAGGNFTGAGFFGRGVEIAGITRAHSAFLSREAAATHAMAAADGTRLAQLQRLEQAFGLGEAGLGHAASQVLNAFTDVASRPADLSARQVVLGRVEDFALRMRSAAGELDSLQAGVTQELRVSVQSANVLAQRVAGLNEQISRVQGLGHPPNDLLDQRDQAIKELSGFVQVTQIPAEDGTVGLFIGGGQRLVLGNQALELRALPDAYDPNVLRLGVREGGTDRPIAEGSVAGGSIAGLLRFQSQDLPDAQNQLGRLGETVSRALNDQQALGLDLTGAQGGPMLATGAPRVLPNPHNQGAAAVTLEIRDGALLQASDYELMRDGEGFRLTRLGAPQASFGFSAEQLAEGVAVDGLRIRVEGAAAGGDRFLLQPLRQVGRDMQRVMDDPQRIAAAPPLTATQPPRADGSLPPAVSVVQRAPMPEGRQADFPLQLTVVEVGGGEVVFSIAGSPPQRVSAGEFVSRYGTELRFASVPRPGDVIELNRTHPVGAYNGNALAMLQLRDAPLVGQRLEGGTPQGGQTLTDAYAGLVGDIGVRVQGGRAAAETSRRVAQEAEAARSNGAAVNLDEEAARLIEYQQSYQAAAKVLQVAQSVFDTLMQTVSR